MSNARGKHAPAIEHLDPKQASDTTESGELERPPTRRIDCAGSPEVAARRAGSPGGRGAGLRRQS